MTLRLILIRHGLSSFNRERRIQGRDDLSRLTPEGSEQARRAGRALRDLTLDAACCSPLSRARDTAIEVLRAMGSPCAPEASEDLLEVDLGPWSGSTAAELAQRHPREWATWKRDPGALELTRADGRSFRPMVELMEQARRFLDTLIGRHPPAGPDRTVLLVAHNMILRAVLLQAIGGDLGAIRSLRFDNASISVLNLAGSGWREAQIESLNGTHHLGAGWTGARSGPRLILVRHGETDWNRQGRFQGQIDIPLNATGLDQAEAARRCLAEVPMDRAYTSTMARPRRTAEAILRSHPGVPLVTTTGLIEIGHGAWEGRLEGEIREGWPELLAAWKSRPETVRMPGGETIGEVADRSVRCWRQIAAGLAPPETALVVAHDAVNKTILCDLLGLTPASIWAIKQGNGGVSVIDYPEGAAAMPVVTCLNSTSHLGGVLDRTAAGAL